MKINDIEVGQRYYTRVSGDKILVEVVAVIQVNTFCGRTIRRKVRVKRVDNGRVLDKPREASSLHLTTNFDD